MGYGTINAGYSAGSGSGSFDEHVENRNNPHGVTAQQVGAAQGKHTHSTAVTSALATEAIYMMYE